MIAAHCEQCNKETLHEECVNNVASNGGVMRYATIFSKCDKCGNRVLTAHLEQRREKADRERLK